MPEYLSPGVYVEEVSSGIKPIEGVGTSTGAFVGGAVRGPVDQATLVTNFTQFVSTFGGFHQGRLLAYGVQHFFAEGGTRCYVVRAFRPSAAAVGGQPAGVDNDRAFATLSDATPTEVLRVLALNVGSWGNNITVEITAPAFHPDNVAADPKFGLVVKYRDSGGTAEVVETYNRVSMREFNTDGRPNPLHVEAVINGSSKYIEVDDLSADPAQIAPPAVGSTDLAGGGDGQALTAADLVPIAVNGRGIFAFDPVDDINIVAVPDLMSSGISRDDARRGTRDGFTYCENREDCFFVADPPTGLNPTEVRQYKQGSLTGLADTNPFNSTFGALYYPWIRVADPVTGGTRLCPPSGAIAGSYSATDVARGVHKAPAGTENGFLNVAAGLERVVTKGEQDTLNPEGVNVIRRFPDAGIVIWGARTVSADPEWKYVNVRRLFLFLEESIDEGTQWVVFEPNDEKLWKKIIRNVSDFLRIQWREGMLVGSKEEEAFFVKCDAETNPPESVDQGRVVTLIGVAPSKPAEFVIFRISQFRPDAG